MNTVVLNIENKAYTHKAFFVQLGYWGEFSTVIFADNEQDALDVLIDHIDEHHPEFLMSRKDASELTEAEVDYIISGGNYGKHTVFLLMS